MEEELTDLELEGLFSAEELLSVYGLDKEDTDSNLQGFDEKLKAFKESLLKSEGEEKLNNIIGVLIELKKEMMNFKLQNKLSFLKLNKEVTELLKIIKEINAGVNRLGAELSPTWKDEAKIIDLQE